MFCSVEGMLMRSIKNWVLRCSGEPTNNNTHMNYGRVHSSNPETTTNKNTHMTHTKSTFMQG